MTTAEYLIKMCDKGVFTKQFEIAFLVQIVWNSLRSVLASDLLDEGILNSDFLEKCKLNDSLESLVFVLQENYYWQQSFQSFFKFIKPKFIYQELHFTNTITDITQKTLQETIYGVPLS